MKSQAICFEWFPLLCSVVFVALMAGSCTLFQVNCVNTYEGGSIYFLGVLQIIPVLLQATCMWLWRVGTEELKVIRN